jgi:aminopeptidase N
MPALSPNAAVRDSVFESFKAPENRERESWVLDAVAYLNHPLRAEQAEHYVQPGLELVADIQRTGDIFFPLGWLHALLDGHASDTVAETVRRFLDEHPDYPPRLRAKILQAADGLFRAANMIAPSAG